MFTNQDPTSQEQQKLRVASASYGTALTFDAYRGEAMRTAFYPERGTFLGLLYITTKLHAEAGEIADKVLKAWRDCNGVIIPERRAALLAECGDVLWYLAATTDELGAPFSHVAHQNIEKLQDRMARGVLGGNGDTR
jgi:NTP pyrophosphatase (non-canonical NTP hydrolase)